MGCDGRRNGAVDLSRDRRRRRTGVFVRLAARCCAGYGWRRAQRMGLGACAPGPLHGIEAGRGGSVAGAVGGGSGAGGDGRGMKNPPGGGVWLDVMLLYPNLIYTNCCHWIIVVLVYHCNICFVVSVFYALA